MNLFNEMINRLTDVYAEAKNDNSIIGKLIKIKAEQFDKMNDLFLKIQLWRSIDYAEGTTLDLIGKGFGQLREGTNDTGYRILIKSKILRDRSDGTINNIIQNISFLLQTQEKYVLVKALWTEGRPATLYSELDYTLTESLGLPVEKFADIFNDITAAGVGMDIYFKGDFLFSDTYDQIQENDSDHGFTEVVSDELYHVGDFTFSPITVSQTDEMRGFANDDMGSGGRFGALYDADEEKFKAW